MADDPIKAVAGAAGHGASGAGAVGRDAARQGYQKSLDPAVLDRLSGLSLVARTVVEGMMAGQHRSPHKGSSIEFAQHRPYVPGDELKHVDWKIFARSNRLVVKEFVEETNFTCRILLDASESMGFGTLRWSKLDYARWAAAALAHLVIRQRDAAGLVTFDSAVREAMPPTNGTHQLAAVLNALENTRATGNAGVGSVLASLVPQLKSRGIVAVFSDFFDDLDTIVSAIRQLRHSGHDPILFQILDPQELDFEFESLLRLDGLEGAGRQKVDPKAIRVAYKEEIAKHNEALRLQAQRMNADLVTITTDTPLDVALSTYLAHRSARARSSG
ncbi:MAG: DUF58 domain-containing protein [Planctomycetota bacterium]